MAQYPSGSGSFTELDPVATAEIAGLTPAAIGAATPAQVSAAVAGVTPASLGVPTNAQLASAISPLATSSALAAAIAGVTAASIGAATPGSVAAAIAGVTPASLGVPTNAQLSTAIDGVTAASIGAAVPSDITAAIAGVTPASIGAATSASVTAAVAGLAATTYVDAADATAVKLSTASTQIVTSTVATSIPLAAQGAASQSANILVAQNSAAQTLFAVDPNGNLLTSLIKTVSSPKNRLVLGGDGAANGSVHIPSTAVGNVPLVVAAAASQTGNLQEWRDSSASALAKIGPTGVFIAPQMQAIGTSSGSVPAVVQAAVSQSVDMQRWQDSGAAVKSSINSFGSLLVRTTTQFGSAAISAQTPATTAEGLIIRATASQSADLMQAQNSAASVVMRVSSGGALTTVSDLAVGSATVGTARVLIVGGTPSTPTLIVRNAASQTAAGQDWQNSAGTSVAAMDGGGGLYLNGSFRSGLLLANSGGAAGNFIGLANIGTAPASTPVGGGVAYSEGGALKWKGSAGTVTVIAPA